MKIWYFDRWSIDNIRSGHGSIIFGFDLIVDPSQTVKGTMKSVEVNCEEETIRTCSTR